MLYLTATEERIAPHGQLIRRRTCPGISSEACPAAAPTHSRTGLRKKCEVRKWRALFRHPVRMFRRQTRRTEIFCMNQCMWHRSREVT